jgi:hypothetical protein
MSHPLLLPCAGIVSSSSRRHHVVSSLSRCHHVVITLSRRHLVVILLSSLCCYHHHPCQPRPLPCPPPSLPLPLLARHPCRCCRCLAALALFVAHHPHRLRHHPRPRLFVARHSCHRCHRPHCCRLCPRCCHLPTTLVAIAIAPFVTCHHCCHCPCRPRHRRRSPATLFAVATALFVAVPVAVAVSSPPPLLPSPLPCRPCPLHHQPPSLPSPLPLPPSPWPSSLLIACHSCRTRHHPRRRCDRGRLLCTTMPPPAKRRVLTKDG